jgi:hypothetical protein
LNEALSYAAGMQPSRLSKVSLDITFLRSLERQAVWSNHHAGEVLPAALR